MASYTDLQVWKEARILNKQVSDLARKLPDYELYGLSSQMRRASVSIGSNIAEGRGRGTLKDYIHFLYMARGSAYELGTQLMYTVDMGYMDEATVRPILGQLSKVTWQLHNLMDSLKAKAKQKSIKVDEDIDEYGD